MAIWQLLDLWIGVSFLVHRQEYLRDVGQCLDKQITELQLYDYNSKQRIFLSGKLLVTDKSITGHHCNNMNIIDLDYYRSIL